MPRVALSDQEKRLRRREALGLRAFLADHGRLIPEVLPPDGTAWCRASRSAHPFSDRSVKSLLKKGSFTLREIRYLVAERMDGCITATDCA